MKTKLLCAIAAVAFCGIASATSAVTIGKTDSGNCSLGGCLTGSLIEYEQIYSASAFTGPIAFSRISFFDLPSSAPNLLLQQPTPNAVFEQGIFTISFATTTAPLGSAFPIGPLTNGSTFFTGTLGGQVNAAGAYIIDGSSYNYDPSVGNLVLIMIGTNVSATCCSYFDNDSTGNFMSRALFETGEGTVADQDGLVTEFSTPLPATLPLFATGLCALGLLGWRRKKKAALAA